MVNMFEKQKFLVFSRFLLIVLFNYGTAMSDKALYSVKMIRESLSRHEPCTKHLSACVTFEFFFLTFLPPSEL